MRRLPSWWLVTSLALATALRQVGRQGRRRAGRCRTGGRARGAGRTGGDRDGHLQHAEGHRRVREVLPGDPSAAGVGQPAGDRLHPGRPHPLLQQPRRLQAGVLPPGGAVLPLDGGREEGHGDAGLQEGGGRPGQLRQRRPHRAARGRDQRSDRGVGRRADGDRHRDLQAAQGHGGVREVLRRDPRAAGRREPAGDRLQPGRS